MGGRGVSARVWPHGAPPGAGSLSPLTDVVVVSVVIKLLMGDVFFYFEFLLLLSGDHSVGSAQDHLEVVGRVPDGETALCPACCEAPSNRPGLKALQSREASWVFGRAYLSCKQCAADRTQQELISIPPHRNLSPGDLLFLTKMAACHG